MMLARTDESLLAKWWFGLDKQVFLETLFLIVVGSMMIFSASPYSATRINLGEYAYIKKYLAYFALGLCTLFASSLLDARQIRRLSILMFAIFAAFLIMTMFEPAIKGSRRWVTRLGPSFQPSEFLKPIVAVITAMWMVKIKKLYAEKDARGAKRNVGMLLGMFGAIAALLRSEE
ncbi:MAG: FtsW/RodA/SpoVE family cell cycle protein, partial [Rickettsiales bacterium]|nr:FtsW/RodA/SpoVE family cell cycle protein [Rickettsiales bacterium]